MSLKVFTPTTLNTEIKSVLSNGNFFNITIEGEISNWKPSSTGHVYFNLKDESSIVSCVLWSGTYKNLPKEILTSLVEGTKLNLVGSLDFYIPGGKCNFIVKTITLQGKGDLWKKFEILKKELENQGLFLQERKRPIKQFNFNIAVITSETGAVIEDIKRTLQSRFPLVTIHLYPTTVQGERAKDSIVKNIQLANTKQHDVIILARGGGSMEDLWSFNEKDVAFAIFNSKIPIISAIGHETDFTIADFVADRRAPTPTASATFVVPDWRDILEFIKSKSKQLEKEIESNLNTKKINFIEKAQYFEMLYNTFLKKYSDRIINFDNKLTNLMLNVLKNKKHIIEKLSSRLDDLNPKSILSRGYSLVSHNGKIVKSIYNVNINDEIDINLFDGKLKSLVKDKKENDE